MVEWFQQRHGWALDPAWLRFCPGVVTALDLLVRTFTDPGDAVIIQPPVYHPFFSVVRDNGRRVVENPLVFAGGRYSMDFDDLERKAAAGARMLILCSPHNPVGRVWERSELGTLADICLRHGIVVVSDEIHADLIMPGFRHVCIASLDERIAAATVTCISPNKTFNIAGIPTANIVIPDPERRAAFSARVRALGLSTPNVFGAAALTAAYREGGPWVDALMEYVHANYLEVVRFAGGTDGRIRVLPCEGTYLAWLDCRGMGLDDIALGEFFTRRAGVWLDEGTKFGLQGSGYMRMNLACPRDTLLQALGRIRREL